MADLKQFPQPMNVRYLDLFDDEGEIQVRRIPISSAVHSGERFVEILKLLGFLQVDIPWKIYVTQSNGRLRPVNHGLWYVTEMLWIIDEGGEYAPLMLHPTQFSDGLDVSELEKVDDPKIVRLDHHRARRGTGGVARG